MKLTSRMRMMELFYFDRGESERAIDISRKIGISYDIVQRNLLELHREGMLNRMAKGNPWFYYYSPIKLEDKLKRPKTQGDIKLLEEGDILELEDGRLVHYGYLLKRKGVRDSEKNILTIRRHPEHRVAEHLIMKRKSIIPLKNGKVRLEKIESKGSHDLGPYHTDYWFYGIPLIEETSK